MKECGSWVILSYEQRSPLRQGERHRGPSWRVGPRPEEPSPPGETFAEPGDGCPEDPHPNPLPPGEGARAAAASRMRGVVQRSPQGEGARAAAASRMRGVVQRSPQGEGARAAAASRMRGVVQRSPQGEGARAAAASRMRGVVQRSPRRGEDRHPRRSVFNSHRCSPSERQNDAGSLRGMESDQSDPPPEYEPEEREAKPCFDR